MGEKLSSSWTLIRSCVKVLKADKELMIFPLISSILVIMISISFALPIFLSESSEVADQISWPVIFVYYFLIYFIIIFLNSALIGAAMIRLKGGNPTLRDGLKIAFNHLVPIIGYALISSTLGLILQWFQEKLGLLGKIFAFLSNFAWNVITFLVVPVLVTENIGPVEAIKRSATLLKKTWGEQIIGNIGISMFFGLLALGLTIFFVPIAVYTSLAGNLNLTILTGSIYILILLMLTIVGSTLSSIYTAALYRYAAEGTVHADFGEVMMRNSFIKK